MNPDSLIGWRRLGCAILLQAYRDTMGKKRRVGEDARAFLQSEGATWLVIALDLDRHRFDGALTTQAAARR